MQHRPFGRTGHDDSVLIYGAASLGDVDQDTANASVQLALDAGINHFDVAASYGDAELRLGPLMSTIRSDIFLSTKTEKRGAEESWAQINASLERLQTDQLDLIQIHSVGDLAELDKVTAKGGVLESVIRARDEGLARFIGLTGHSHTAPATHLEGLRRFPFDSILTPWNYTLSTRPAYAAAFEALSAEITSRGIALMCIKSAARHVWPEGADHRYSTWYEPFDDQERINAAVAWVLSHPQVTGLPTAGDVHLLPLLIEAEKHASTTSREDAAQVLAAVADYDSPFVAMG
jgi:aryl-alcohol dehydrogenase-like predicted oxidoreductase